MRESLSEARESRPEAREAAVETFSIRKSFGSLCAVDDVSIRVERGEFFGFLGPNGAGKSTLIRILTTVLRPTSGTARVAGHDVAHEPGRVRRSIGVVPQSLSSDLDLTGRENMDIFGRFYGVPRVSRLPRIEELLAKVGLGKRADELVAAYSGGMRRRLDIARALVHRPALLFLDEPTTGLDPQSRRVVWDMLEALMRDYELTIFLTTHYLEEAEVLCRRVAIIDHGRIIALGSPEELKAQIPGNDTVVLTLRGDGEKARAAAERESYVHRAVMEESTLQCYVDDGARDLAPLVQLMERLGVKVDSVSIRRLSLEDVFLHHTGRSIREEEGRKVSRILGAGVPRKLGG
jgi:ABC-2 type transport system ATP-binding protein